MKRPTALPFATHPLRLLVAAAATCAMHCARTPASHTPAPAQCTPPVRVGTASVSRGGLPSSLPIDERWTCADARAEVAWHFDHAPGGYGDLVVRVTAKGLTEVAHGPDGVRLADATGHVVQYGDATWVDAHGARTDVPARVVNGAVEFRVGERAVDRAAYPAVLDPWVSAEIPMPGIAGAPNAGLEPAIAFDGVNFFAVWSEQQHLRAARFTPDGVLLDPSGLQLTSGMNVETMPAIAFDGTNYLLAFVSSTSGNPSIVVDRLARDGTVLDSFPSIVSNVDEFRPTVPSVAFDGSRYLVAWETQPDPSNVSLQIRYVRVGAGGAVLDANPVSLGSHGYNRRPSVAGGAGQWLIAWDLNSMTINASRVGDDGTLLDASPLVLTTLAPVGPVGDSAVSWGGSDYLVAWSFDGATTGVQAVRVGADGVSMIPPVVIGVDGHFDLTEEGTLEHRGGLAVHFDGSRFFGVWRGSTASTVAASLDGAWESPVGPLSSAGSFALEPADPARLLNVDVSPAIASDGAGRSAVAYMRATGVFAHLTTFLSANGQACTTGMECRTGFCIDGVCCDTVCGAGDAHDCQACAVSAGAAVDGVCGAAGAAVVCRDPAGSCDLAEHCNGTALTCPSDTFVRAETPCAPEMACQSTRACDGMSAACPSSQPLSDGTPCDAGGPCAVNDRCAAGACVQASAGSCAEPAAGDASTDTGFDGGDAGRNVTGSGMCSCRAGGASRGGVGAGGISMLAAAMLRRRRRARGVRDRAW